MEMDAPPPRLCHVTKWEDFDGYGFNLHAERNKLGQFIGKVDPNSPAEAAGLCEGDKIIEVNGVNISQENHKQVVQRIKAVKEETRLLVVDTKTEIYHKEKDIIITSSLPYVQHLSSDKHFEYIDTRIQTPSVPTLEHTPSVKGRNSPVGGRDSPAEGRDSPTGGRDSPDSVASLDEIPLDHRDVKREDSSSSERTLSNRSSLSSIGKQTKTVEDNMKAGKEDDKMENGGFSKDSPDEKIPQSPELADLPEAPEMPKLLQAVEITARTPSPSAPSPPSPSPPRSRASSVSSADEHELKTMEQEKIRNAAESSDSESDKDDRNVLAVSKGPNSVSSGSPRSTPSPQGSGKWTGREGGLDLPLTAREMRERIASMKKKDKRVDERMDFKKKYEIIKTL